MTEDNTDRGWPFDDLFEAIKAAARAEDGTARRSKTGKNGRVSIDFTVRTGLGPGAPGRKGHPGLGERSPTSETECPVQVDTDGRDRRVTVDLVDTNPTPADISTTTTGSQLRIKVDGAVVATTALGADGPWSVEKTSLNNGVYQIWLTR